MQITMWMLEDPPGCPPIFWAMFGEHCSSASCRRRDRQGTSMLNEHCSCYEFPMLGLSTWEYAAIHPPHSLSHSLFLNRLPLFVRQKLHFVNINSAICEYPIEYRRISGERLAFADANIFLERLIDFNYTDAIVCTEMHTLSTLKFQASCCYLPKFANQIVTFDS